MCSVSVAFTAAIRQDALSSDVSTTLEAFLLIALVMVLCQVAVDQVSEGSMVQLHVQDAEWARQHLLAQLQVGFTHQHRYCLSGCKYRLLSLSSSTDGTTKNTRSKK